MASARSRPFSLSQYSRVIDALLARDAAHHVFGVGHARHLPGIHEGDDLEVLEPCIAKRVDELDLARRRYRPGLDLEAFARAFFVDAYRLRNVRHDLSSSRFGYVLAV
jgi:hypothetical protein